VFQRQANAAADPAQAKAQIEQAKAQVAQAMAAVTQAQANQRRTELDISRYAPLAKDGFVSQQEFDNTVQNNLANKAAMVGCILSPDRTHIAVLGHQRLVERRSVTRKHS
jgi:multidrug resistance efflux pump